MSSRSDDQSRRIGPPHRAAQLDLLPRWHIQQKFTADKADLYRRRCQACAGDLSVVREQVELASQPLARARLA